jgi:glutamate 5-kinase
MKVELRHREFLAESRRVVVKIGTRVIARKSGRPDRLYLKRIVRQVAALRRQGYEVVIVTSGAIGAGMESLGISPRPTLVADLQMCAAVGQSRLMTQYDLLFAREKMRVGQLLLTHADFQSRVRCGNTRRTLEHLLRAGVIPIINENDVVADEEIKGALSFGDNDYLASLVVKLVRADLLILLTTVDGLLAPTGRAGALRRVPCVEKLGPDIFKLVNPGANPLSKGGMDSKLTAAQAASQSGCSVVIANGRQANVLTAILDSADVGTLILANPL